jgi:hypothetical protein
MWLVRAAGGIGRQVPYAVSTAAGLLCHFLYDDGRRILAWGESFFDVPLVLNKRTCQFPTFVRPLMVSESCQWLEVRTRSKGNSMALLPAK